MFTSCVLREVAPGDTQYVPVSEVPFLTRQDTVFTGEFRSQVESHGPSGSHRRTICLPVGRLSQSAPCVLREVSPGDMEFVPVNEVPSLTTGERIFAGAWRRLTENLGPSGSHRRTICLPQRQPVECRAVA